MILDKSGFVMIKFRRFFISFECFIDETFENELNERITSKSNRVNFKKGNNFLQLNFINFSHSFNSRDNFIS
jgi:hypothetical protein